MHADVEASGENHFLFGFLHLSFEFSDLVAFGLDFVLALFVGLGHERLLDVFGVDAGPGLGFHHLDLLGPPLGYLVVLVSFALQLRLDSCFDSSLTKLVESIREHAGSTASGSMHFLDGEAD